MRSIFNNHNENKKMKSANANVKTKSTDKPNINDFNPALYTAFNLIHKIPTVILERYKFCDHYINATPNEKAWMVRFMLEDLTVNCYED
jgi:hypothetical protein